MRSSFFEFNVAITGLFTSRAGLETVSHNVANANTKGYSRQVALTKANTPLTLYNGRGMVGTGSQVYSVIQIRDFYLDKKYWNGMATLGEYSVKRSQLTLTQTALSELEGTGLSTQFNTFFETIQDLITNTGDATYRNNVIQSAESLTTFLKDTYEAFVKQQKDVNEEIKMVVSTINSLGTQIHTLNEKIRVSEAAGDNANDLRDQRATLIDELSRYVNVEVSEVDYGSGDKRFFVKINGQDFVMNNNLRLLSVRERTYETGSPAVTKDGSRNAEDLPGMYDIYWGDSTNKFDVYSETLSGELKGLIDLRDGNNGNHVSFGYLAGYYDAATGQLTVPLSQLSRLDLAASGGVLTLTDGLTGQILELTYDSYEIDSATGNAIFTMAYKDAAEKSKIDNYFNRLEAGGGTIDVGKTSDYKGIPYYLSRLNNLARTFASAINFGQKLNGSSVDGVTGHVNGWNLDQSHGDPPTLFFTYWDSIQNKYVDYNDLNEGAGFVNIYKITANNLFVNPELMVKPRLLNASDTETGGVDNNQVLFSMLKINTDDTLFSEGSMLDYIIGMTGELAIDVKQANNFETNYNTLTVMVDNQRLSVMGVNINEEMVDMIRFNQQYQAASRLINIIDGIYDTLCNRLGLL